MKRLASEFGGGRPRYREPYTQIGIERLLCSRGGCGRKAYATWGGCADGNIQRPFCPECDVELNRIVQEWMNDPHWEQKIIDYANDMERKIGRKLEIDWLYR